MAKSRRASTVANVCSGEVESSGDEEGTWASEADFSTDGLLAVRAIFRGWKAWFSIRYCWIEDLPAQMPGVWVSFGDYFYVSVYLFEGVLRFTHRRNFRSTFLMSFDVWSLL